ncbi:MAG: DUF2953 domain-containing protein [Lachnospiraceae bacterium]|nr:DUF2953 domain-containing protein [Lachnospiraceae bacterium]
MHIVLLILKVLGITLLILLGIILLFVILLLVAPFRYTVDAEYYGDIKGIARIRWLIFVLDLKGVYGENRFLYYLKSFWFTISTNDENDKHYKSGTEEPKSAKNKLFGKKSSDKQVSKESEPSKFTSKKKTQEEADNKVSSDSVKQTGDTAEKVELKRIAEKEPAQETTQPKSSVQNPDDDFERYMAEQDQLMVKKEEETSEKKGIFTKIREKLEFVLEWITTIPMKIHYKIGEILSKILDFFANINQNVDNLNQKKDDVMVKVRKVQKLWKMESTKHALQSVIKYLKQILKHVAPRKYSGKIHFGMEDPSSTGQILGVFGALMPLYRDHILVRPDFENKVMEGEIHLKGRIRIGFFAIIAIKAFLNRDLMKTIKRVKTIVEA